MQTITEQQIGQDILTVNPQVFNRKLEDLTAIYIQESLGQDRVRPALERPVLEFLDQNGINNLLSGTLEKIKQEQSPEELFLTKRLIQESVTDFMVRDAILKGGSEISISLQNHRLTESIKLYQEVLLRLSTLAVDQLSYKVTIEDFIGSVDMERFMGMKPSDYERRPEALEKKVGLMVAEYMKLSITDRKRAMGIIKSCLDTPIIYMVAEMVLNTQGDQDWEEYDSRLKDRSGSPIFEPKDWKSKENMMLALRDENERGDSPQSVIGHGKLSLRQNPDATRTILEIKEHPQAKQ